jgi:hypothetical protein
VETWFYSRFEEKLGFAADRVETCFYSRFGFEGDFVQNLVLQQI